MILEILLIVVLTGFASIATWPGRGLRNSLHIRLSRARDRSAGVTLTVGERRFQLAANTADAWATDAPSDRAIVAALRSGRSMSVEAVGAAINAGTNCGSCRPAIARLLPTLKEAAHV